MSFMQVSLNPTAGVRLLGRPAMVFLNAQKFELGCVVSYMEGEFPGVNVIGICDPEEARALAGQQVALAVITLPSGQVGQPGGSRDVERIARHFPDAAIAIATQAGLSYEAIMHDLPGLRGVFPTSLSPAVVAAIIRVIIAGGNYFHRGGGGSAGEPQDASSVFTAPQVLPETATPSENAAPVTTAAPAFTMRETQILQKLALGLQNKLIAAALAMPENTVKVHVRNIMRKLKSSNRTAAVIAAQRLNVIMRH